MSKNNKGFTLIELLVVIAIIGILSTLAVLALNSARAKSRDSKRVADIKQIQASLELYYNDFNTYPVPTTTNLVLGGANTKVLCGNSAGFAASCAGSENTYMSFVPTTALPSDGPCSDAANAYVYNASGSGAGYTINFCVGGVIGNLSAGPHIASHGGIQ